MKAKLFSAVLLLILAVIPALAAMEANEVAIVSLLDGGLNITNRDGNQHQAVVNFPVFPGDILSTAAEGRAEIQFSNGSLVRLDKDSELLIGTIQAPSLTTRFSITSLALLKGAVYVISNRYDREILQVLTQETAVSFPKNTNVEVFLDPQAGTQVISHWGRPELIYTSEDGLRQLSRQLSGKSAVLLDPENGLQEMVYTEEGDFLAWNRYVDDNFKALHHEKSFLPRKITRNPLLQYWTERWSSSFGEWVYDRLFGYVWKSGMPEDPSRRPFWNARRVTINDEVYLVPDEPWGWAPANMGTWVFLKKWGWVWIPGTNFSPGSNLFAHWIYCYWSRNNYYSSLFEAGIGGPEVRNALATGEIDWDVIPSDVQGVFKKLESSYPHLVKAFMKEQHVSLETVTLAELPVKSAGTGHGIPEIDSVRAKTQERAEGGITVKSVLAESDQEAARFPAKAIAKERLEFRHDWNPDAAWAIQNRTRLVYSSDRNSVQAPEKRLDSSSLTVRQRDALNRNTGASHAGGTAGAASASSSGTASSDSASGSGSSSKSKD